MAAGTVLYGIWGGSWFLYLPFLLLVDVSMVGYLRGPRLGAITYNLAHNWAAALLVFGVGWLTQVPGVALAGAVLIAHVGADRTLGYGLKLPSGFQDTHLGRIGRG